MAHALSLLRWQLYAWKTQHAFVLSQGHTANSVTSTFGSLQFEFGSMVYISTTVHVKFAVEHSTTSWQLICSRSLYQVNKLSPSGVNSLSCSKRVDHVHQALLAVVIQTPHWYHSLHKECSILDEPNTLWTYKTAAGHIQRDRDESSDQHVPALLYVH